MLHAEVVGSGPRVVLVHGFTQTRRSWAPLADRLKSEFELVLVDAPGHGQSAAVAADLWEGADLLGQAGGRAAYLGYSMGGRFCLHLALSDHACVERLVLVGATAGIEDLSARMERRKADKQWAQLLADEGLAAFLQRWLDGPLFRGLSPEAANREARMENTVEGLSSSLRLAGTGRQEPLWHRLPELDMPVLLVVGERDEKFTAVAERMQQAIGDNADLVVVPDAGHAVHLERPDAFADVVRPFLARATIHPA